MDRLQIINSITNKDWDENDLHNYHFLIIAVEIAKKNLNRNKSAIETHFHIHFDVYLTPIVLIIGLGLLSDFNSGEAHECHCEKSGTNQCDRHSLHTLW